MSYLEGVSILALVDGREDALVDPEGHGGRDQSQGKVGQDRDDRDVLYGQEDDQDGSEDDSGVARVLPVDEVMLNLRCEPNHRCCVLELSRKNKTKK